MAPGDHDDDKKTCDVDEEYDVSPPDGGWGWVVCISAFFTMVILDGMMFSFGVLFIELLEYFQSGKGQTAMVGSALMGIHLLAGPITSALVNAWGVRVVTMIGSVIATIAFASSVLSPNITTLTILYGFMGGIGVSMIYLPSILAVGFYFEKRRALANGITQSGSGLGTFVYSPLTDYLLVEYGWKGTMLILSGLVLNCLACGALYRPIEVRCMRSKQNKKSPNSCDKAMTPERTPLTNQNVNNATELPSKTVAHLMLARDNKDITLMVPSLQVTTSRSVPSSPNLPREQRKGSKYLLAPTNIGDTSDTQVISRSHGNVYSLANGHICAAQSGSKSQIFGTKGSLDAVPLNMKLFYRKDAFYSGSLRRLPEYQQDKTQSLYSLPQASISPETVNDTATTCCSMLHDKVKDLQPMLKQMMGLSLLRSPVFILSMMSMVLWTTHSTVLTLLPDFAVIKGVTRDEAAFLLSIIGCANTAARILAGWISDRPEVNCLVVNIVALITGGITCACMAFTPIYGALAFEATIFGLCMGTWTSLRPIILVELLGLDKLTNAFGLVAMFQGAAFLVGPPLAGALYEYTGSYLLPFVIAGGAFILSGIICCILCRVHQNAIKKKEWEKMSINGRTDVPSLDVNS